MVFEGRILETYEGPLLKEKERAFVYELVHDARAPLTQIARKLRISKDQAHHLLEKLSKNVLLHTSAVVDLSALGYFTYHAFFVINDDNMEKRNEFITHLVNHPNTKSLVEYTDRWELEWVVVARDIREFDELIMRLTTQFSSLIVEKTKLAVIKGYKSTSIAERDIRNLKPAKQHDVDATDLQLLSLLHSNARAPSYELGEKLNLTANAIRYRIKKLEDSGLIRYFTATVNLNALGYHYHTVGIIFRSLSASEEAKFQEFVRQQRFIIRAVKVLGHWDVLLTIISDTIRHFHETIKNIENVFSVNIVNYESLIAYHEHVYKYVPDVVTQSSQL